MNIGPVECQFYNLDLLYITSSMTKYSNCEKINHILNY